MNEHLNPIFEIVLPTIDQARICYWVYGGIAIAGINCGYLRPNPDVDVFVMDDDYNKTIELVAHVEKELGWEHKDAPPQRGRPKRDWYLIGNSRDIFSVVPAYAADDRVRFIFGRDFVPQSILTSVVRRIGTHSFVTPNTEFIKELLMSKVNSGNLIRERREKLKKDAKVIMTGDEYLELCARLDRYQK